MTIFRSYTFSWWQVGIFKLALLSIGAIIGSYWNEFFASNMTVVVIVAIIAGLYSGYITITQK